MKSTKRKEQSKKETAANIGCFAITQYDINIVLVYIRLERQTSYPTTTLRSFTNDKTICSPTNFSNKRELIKTIEKYSHSLFGWCYCSCWCLCVCVWLQAVNTSLYLYTIQYNTIYACICICGKLCACLLSNIQQRCLTLTIASDNNADEQCLRERLCVHTKNENDVCC